MLVNGETPRLAVTVLTAIFAVPCAVALPDLIPLPHEIVEMGGTCPAGAEVRVEKMAGIQAEGYELFVATNGVMIRHSDEAGLFYANVTLGQLRSSGANLPCVEIKDSPAYRWRGVMVDDARHFLGKEAIKKVLDLMGQYKLNVFHWHLVDDQGWRIEIKGHPELVEFGAVRPASVAYGPRPQSRKKATSAGNIAMSATGHISIRRMTFAKYSTMPPLAT